MTFLLPEFLVCMKTFKPLGAKAPDEELKSPISLQVRTPMFALEAYAIARLMVHWGKPSGTMIFTSLLLTPSDRRKRLLPLRKSHSFTVDGAAGCGSPTSSDQLKAGLLPRMWTVACDGELQRQTQDGGGRRTSLGFGDSSPSSRVSRKVETWMNSCAVSPLELQVRTSNLSLYHTSLSPSRAVFAVGAGDGLTKSRA